MENSRKPPSKWTLEEAQEECMKREECDDKCPIRVKGFCAVMQGPPCEWDLGDKPHFTEDEVAQASAAEILFGEKASVRRGETGLLYVCNKPAEYHIPGRLFPSILPGQLIDLEEIVGDVDD